MDEKLRAIREFVPSLGQGKHKGQAGKVAVLGGCREYTGAPYFAAISALKLGADLSHVFCSKDAATVIKSYSPELIVHPVMRESWDAGVAADGDERDDLVKQVVADVAKWLPRFDCLVIGPGLGRDPLLMECVARIMRDARRDGIPMVIDGDGLTIVTEQPELVKGYPLAILTPNVNEHKRLIAKMLGEPKENIGSEDMGGQLRHLAQLLGGVTVVQKGPSDRISDGTHLLECSEFGSPRRCGGQGDVLSGSTATFMAWARQWSEEEEGETKGSSGGQSPLTDNPAMMAAYAGCLLVRHAAMAAFQRHKRSTVTTDIIQGIGESVEELLPVGDIGDAH